MNTLKIIKIAEGIFKHVENDNVEFFTTNDLQLNVSGGTINFKSNNGLNINFTVGDITVFDLESLVPIAFVSIDSLLIQLKDFGYPCLSANASSSTSTGGGDASAANQLLANIKLTSIDTKLNSQSTSAKQDLLLAELEKKADLTETQPVSVAVLPLPTSASTSAKQDTGNASVASIDAKTPNLGINNAANSSPITQSIETASATITTQNLVPTGVATAGSSVEIPLQGNSQLAIQAVGTYTGALSVQVTIDGTNWLTITAASFLNTISGAYSATIASATQSIFQFECTGMLKARITALAAVTGSVTVSLRATNGIGLVAIDNALPTGANVIGNIATVTTVTGVTLVTTVATVTLANLGLPSAIADVASAALTITTTTGTLTPTFGCSYEVSIPVTIVTGTLPTMDVDIQESDDSGTNWFTVYSFPRITATGIYRSPKLPLRGNRVRYVQTVGGTTPSFTRAVNRLQSSDSPNKSISQLIDRSIVLTTLNSATPSLNTQNANNAQLTVNVGAITTTAPQLQLEGSDDNGITWIAIGTPLTAVASSTVLFKQADTNFALIRARVSTAGVGVTAGYVLLKGY